MQFVEIEVLAGKICLNKWKRIDTRRNFERFSKFFRRECIFVFIVKVWSSKKFNGIILLMLSKISKILNFGIFLFDFYLIFIFYDNIGTFRKYIGLAFFYYKNYDRKLIICGTSGIYKCLFQNGRIFIHLKRFYTL